MPQLTPIQLEDGTVILIEATEDTNAPDIQVSEAAEKEEEGLTSKGTVEDTLKQFKAIQGTIQSYTKYTLSAFEQVGNANVDKVKLEFGIKISAEAGLPYITKGTAESNLKITVECSFPNQNNQNSQKQ